MDQQKAKGEKKLKAASARHQIEVTHTNKVGRSISFCPPTQSSLRGMCGIYRLLAASGYFDYWMFTIFLR